MFFKFQIIDVTLKKIKSQLANMMTLSNLFLGGFSIIFTIQGELNYSLFLIFSAALLDRFDGMVARKLKIESELGKQLDSMSDIISFGVAPALLLYQGIIHYFSSAGIFITVFFIGCGAFRLARFNITENNCYFSGLPITAAGCILTFSYLGIQFIPAIIYLYLMIILSFLMISTLKVKKI
ncbi:CDP-diacylglycerol--serine O-phosphatidyltransferase [Caldibacillus thermoamylovorans]|uniref:CDP-diacylglycerol--serine O-phosphatidyltransferase n=2 Tax=Bacillales TaxID=1385 RepID=A0A0D0EQL6_9BACI|nr:CDP-diacylglycerol--serine O-phosphatidyltransferase [Caldibacillus thermoamylovorans]KIO62837.1 CDP-diacylglycerol--serine O-phosphatidyltransferase [Caldibacillus thermoamylovorans]KIO67453.1 CDP-diacylglycerol--serine O-phosphatidyltransferase [Caldibacillus thermoamylovorans]KIO70248.1 CDP-diacylglycerol--serine O-phosphatidyltransferase [Caldibacillus thermoamylovorans]